MCQAPPTAFTHTVSFIHDDDEADGSLTLFHGCENAGSEVPQVNYSL